MVIDGLLRYNKQRVAFAALFLTFFFNDMKTLDRIYNDSKEAQAAIFNNTYKYSEICKRADYIKDNIQHITHINGNPVVVNDICNIELHSNNLFFYIKKDSNTYNLLVQPISILKITFNN